MARKLEPLKPGSQKRSRLLERLGLLPYQKPTEEDFARAPAFLTRTPGNVRVPGMPGGQAPAFRKAPAPPVSAATLSTAGGAAGAKGQAPSLETAPVPEVKPPVTAASLNLNKKFVKEFGIQPNYAPGYLVLFSLYVGASRSVLNSLSSFIAAVFNHSRIKPQISDRLLP